MKTLIIASILLLTGCASQGKSTPNHYNPSEKIFEKKSIN